MLQQTQVTRVVERWPRFLGRYPTPTVCAKASVGEVIAEWSGLGYNRRAVYLHRAAATVVDRHGGQVPGDLTDLLDLPGIGPYTARAVLAFADEADVGIVDTNVARVLARWSGRELSPREVQERADASVPAGSGWAWNQTVLDLGATVCRARNPTCDDCPLSDGCVWRGEGIDPAIGSAGVSGRQATFEGSDREGRGRLVAALAENPVDGDGLAAAMGWPDDPQRAERVAARLVLDGLIITDGRCWHLP
ncbi:MAG TPA: A/G-specific adenine glycosylase [Acidimicrobiaceae bacterium]|nr:A/G-specific adenine glycosylase [Acidimicrobiaceae bacterium]